MGYHVVDAVIKRSRARGLAYRLLTLMAERANNDTGQCWQGLRYWAQKLGVKRTAVTSIHTKLVELSELKVEKRRYGNVNLTNLYTITLDGGPPYRRASDKDVPDDRGTGVP